MTKLSISFCLIIISCCIACDNQTQIQDISQQPKVSEERLRLLVLSNLEKLATAEALGQLDSTIYWSSEVSENWIALQEWDSLYTVARGAFYFLFYNDYGLNNLTPYLDEFTDQIPSHVDTIRAKFIYLKGFLAYDEGNSEQSLKYFKEAASIWEQYSNSKTLAGIYNNLAIGYHNLEDYPLAEQYYREGARLSRIYGDTETESENYLNLGRVLFQQGKWQESIACYDKSYALQPLEDGKYEDGLALAYSSGGQHEKALEFAKVALQKTALYEGYNAHGVPLAQRTLGNIYLALEDYGKASQYLQESLDGRIEMEGAEHRYVAITHIELGQAYQGQSLWNLAIKEYQSAIQIFLPTFRPQSVLDCPVSDSLLSREGYLMEALRYKGQCLQKKYEQNNKIEELEAASKHFEAAVHFINQIKLYHTEMGAKAFYGDEYSIPYVEDALQAQLQLYQVTQDPQHQSTAFELAQQATAFLLRESVNEERAMKAAKIPEDTIANLNALNAAISEAQSESAQAESVEAKDSLNQLLFSLKKERLALLEAIENNYPKYYQLKHALSPIPVKDIQGALDSNTLVVKYFLGQDQLYTFAFSQQKFQVLSSPIDSSFYKHIDNFRRTLSDLDYIREKPQEAEQLFLQSSHALYQQLLAPVVSAFPDKNLTQLTIIPDGILNYLSFECLLSKPADNWLAKDAYLIQDYAIRYAYYAGLLLPKAQAVDRKGSRFLGFGTEYNDKTLDRLNMIEQDSVANPQVKEAFRGKSLSKLAFADDEVKEVAQLVNGKSFLNKQATKANFLLHTPDYEVVHVAAHSFIDTDNDSTAYIVFNQSDREDDFLLSLPEIYGLNLDADLITLSACQTGAGALQRSEGVMSLARAFQFAGSSSMVASQWSIADEASSIIMKEFYYRLDEGMSKDEALRQAKLTYLTNDKLSSPAYRIPAYWGAMILIGDEEGLEFDPVGFSWYYWLIGIVLLLVMIMFIRRRLG